MIKAVFKREFLLFARKKSDALNPLFFYLLVVFLFGLALNSAPKIFAQAVPVVMWVAALLCIIMSAERLFLDDFNNGTLEQVLLSPNCGVGFVLAKIAVHWLLTCVPILLISPLLALLFGVPMDVLIVVSLTLLLATPAINVLAALGAALTLGLGRNGVLQGILILPLFIPVLIFALAAVEVAAMGQNFSGILAMLAAFSVGAITFVPFAILMALKVSV